MKQPAHWKRSGLFWVSLVLLCLFWALLLPPIVAGNLFLIILLLTFSFLFIILIVYSVTRGRRITAAELQQYPNAATKLPENMGIFSALKERFRDKTIDKLYVHLLTLGIETEILHRHPLKKFDDIWRYGLAQVIGKNIGYVYVNKYSADQYNPRTRYYCNYLVPLMDIRSRLCWAKLEIKQKSFWSNEIEDIKWTGKTLADILNGDTTLKESLLAEFRLDEPLDIEITSEPFYECAKLKTFGFHFPSKNMFDCLDRIAARVIEVNILPEEVLLEVKVELNPRHKDSEVVNCCVTDRYLLIESKEALKITINHIENCDIRITSYPESSYDVVDYSRAKSMVRLKYHDDSGHRQTVEFEMPTFDASSMRDTLRLVGLTVQ